MVGHCLPRTGSGWYGPGALFPIDILRSLNTIDENPVNKPEPGRVIKPLRKMEECITGLACRIGHIHCIFYEVPNSSPGA
jgi:hypothetical protein